MKVVIDESVAAVNVYFGSRRGCELLLHAIEAEMLYDSEGNWLGFEASMARARERADTLGGAIGATETVEGCADVEQPGLLRADERLLLVKWSGPTPAARMVRSEVNLSVAAGRIRKAEILFGSTKAIGGRSLVEPFVSKRPPWAPNT